MIPRGQVVPAGEGCRLSNQEVARLLIGVTLGFHIILAVSGLALPAFFLVAEYLGLRRGDADYLGLARQGGRAFAVVFAVGAVTGTLVAAELAVVWAPFMAVASQVIILPFFIEGFAFLLEGAFIGMYLYGWDRFRNPWVHWWIAFPIAVASAASGLLITVVNAWMNAPVGFRLVRGKVLGVYPWQAFFNPAMGVENAHVFFTAYAMVAMLLLALAAWDLLRRPDHPAARKAARLSAWIGAVALTLAIVSGDLSGKWLATHQPEKLAAMEALFRTQAYAPETVAGIANPASHTVVGAISIPGLLSWFAYGDVRHKVAGLLQFPRDTWPPVALVHLFFDTMVGLGTLLWLLTLAYLWYDRRATRPRWLLRAALWGGPASVLALEAGWLVDEFGRQPWIIYRVMPVVSGITVSPAVIPVGWAILALLLLIFLAAPYAVARAVHAGATGLPPERRDGP